MKAADTEALDSLVRPAVAGQGYELVDLAWKRELGSSILRITIDRLPGQGYVSHDDCIKVSREVSALLDVHDVLPGHYSLEVSSPGVERPLKRAADFERFLGQKAKIRLRPDAPQSDVGPSAPNTPPRRNFTGTITAVEGELVRLSLEGAAPVALHVSEMEKANLVSPYRED